MLAGRIVDAVISSSRAARPLELLPVAPEFDEIFAGLCASRFFQCHLNHLAFIEGVFEP
jgi:hypothetical protein